MVVATVAPAAGDDEEEVEEQKESGEGTDEEATVSSPDERGAQRVAVMVRKESTTR